MNFLSSEDQIAYRDSVATMLAAEVTAESIRSRWNSPKGVDEKVIQQLNEMGLNAMLVPESGLGNQHRVKTHLIQLLDDFFVNPFGTIPTRTNRLSCNLSS